MNKIKIIKFFILFVLIIFLSFLSYLNYSLNKNISTENKIFYINNGESVSSSIIRLKKKNIFNSELRIKIISYLLFLKPKFKSGKYRITNSDTEYSLLLKIERGNIYQESFTIIEGSTFNKIINDLINSNYIYSDNYKMATLIKNDFQKNKPSLEGLCFPDTYSFSSNIKLEDFFLLCSLKMEKILTEYWLARDKSLPYKTPYDLLIMASIIEKETSIKNEKPLVASVFINRLNKNMRLQADPTVIYGVENFDGNITKKHLREKNNYNTYKIYGLPISPICSPGEDSIMAASNPQKTDYLYFVANDNGEHIFSTNYDDHLKAVNKFQK